MSDKFTAAHQIRGMNDFTTGRVRHDAPPARYCARCACKLYTGNTTLLCAPCERLRPA